MMARSVSNGRRRHDARRAHDVRRGERAGGHSLATAATAAARRAPYPQPSGRSSEDDLRTRAAPVRPAQNDPSHVNPYVNDPPLVTKEPPPIQPTRGGQVHDDMTYIPPVARPEPAAAMPADLEATYIPPRDTPATPRQDAVSAAPPPISKRPISPRVTHHPPRDKKPRAARYRQTSKQRTFPRAIRPGRKSARLRIARRPSRTSPPIRSRLLNRIAA